MLRAAAVELAARSKQFTSVARTRGSLSRLDDALRNRAQHHPLQLDWSNADDFLARIQQHVFGTEPPDLVVAWIHDDQLTLRLALDLANSGVAFRFFHIIGSATVNPAEIADSLLDEFDPPANLDYHQVILGARQSGWRSRWLTDQEISAGVLGAIDLLDDQFVVGMLDRYR
ncbi:hypothetical protein [Natronospirillum operosum]|nr:hypothetical protein [Natronospirillum operosum]